MGQAASIPADTLLGHILQEKFRQQELKSKKLQVWPQYELGNLKWSEVPYVQVFMALHLDNGTQKESKACVAQRDNSRKDTEDILTDPPYGTMQYTGWGMRPSLRQTNNGITR